MKKQKIAIIGDGLTGLTTASALKSLNVDIDLFYKKNNKIGKYDRRTTAISESNFKFLHDELKIIKKEYFWPCNKINLYYENDSGYSNFLNFDQSKKNLMYIFENNKLKKYLFKKLKKIKNIKFISQPIKKIEHDKSIIKYLRKTKNYDLILLCVGNNLDYYNAIVNNRFIKKNYNETSITCCVTANINIKNASQYFLKEGPLAILPFQKNVFSVVWSLNNKFYFKNLNNLKKVILDKLNYIYGSKIKFKLSNIQSFPIFLVLYSKYFKKNSLILGEALHRVHPMAGQGFNLVLRDIKKLYENIKANLKIGLPIKNSLILQNFYKSRKPENILISLGIDLTNSFFKPNKYLKPVKEIIINNIQHNKIIKEISRRVSNSGLY